MKRTQGKKLVLSKESLKKLDIKTVDVVRGGFADTGGGGESAGCQQSNPCTPSMGMGCAY